MNKVGQVRWWLLISPEEKLHPNIYNKVIRLIDRKPIWRLVVSIAHTKKVV
jgi:hypothetical protein